MKKEINYAVGVDFGGTSVKLALVTDLGKIQERETLSTKDLTTPLLWQKAVVPLVQKLKSVKGVTAKNFKGVGIGVPGFVDFEKGVVYELPNVPGWRDVPLKKTLERKINATVRIDNDVNAMALGECRFGSGRSYEHAVFVTLGTGVGGGLLINKQIYRGAYSMGGEIGHISIDMYGRQSSQGRGGVEQYVGNKQIADRARQFLNEGRKSVIHDLCEGNHANITPELICRAAEQKDDVALEVFDYVADCLATAFASITYILQPQVFIIGGGVAQSGRILFEPLKRHLSERLSPHFAKRIELKPASLGNAAGVIGCAALVF